MVRCHNRALSHRITQVVSERKVILTQRNMIGQTSDRFKGENLDINASLALQECALTVFTHFTSGNKGHFFNFLQLD